MLIPILSKEHQPKPDKGSEPGAEKQTERRRPERRIQGHWVDSTLTDGLLAPSCKHRNSTGRPRSPSKTHPLRQTKVGGSRDAPVRDLRRTRRNVTRDKKKDASGRGLERRAEEEMWHVETQRRTYERRNRRCQQSERERRRRTPTTTKTEFQTERRSL